MNDDNYRIYSISVASVYPLYSAKAGKKGRTKAEVDEIIRWLTGHGQKTLNKELADKTGFREFFDGATADETVALADHRGDLRHPSAGYRSAADARNPPSRQTGRRTPEGKPMEKILRQ